MVDLVGSQNGQVAYRAVNWLREAKLVVKPEVLVAFFDRRGGGISS